MKKELLWLFVLLTVMIGCKKKTETVPVDNVIKPVTAAELRDTANFYGSYEGVIPAASGPGIKIILTLNSDSTYKMTTDYIDAREAKYTKIGKYEINNNIITIEGEEGANYYFKIKNNGLMVLNSQKEEISGPLEEVYTLKRVHGL